MLLNETTEPSLAEPSQTMSMKKMKVETRSHQVLWIFGVLKK